MSLEDDLRQKRANRAAAAKRLRALGVVPWHAAIDHYLATGEVRHFGKFAPSPYHDVPQLRRCT